MPPADEFDPFADEPPQDQLHVSEPVGSSPAPQGVMPDPAPALPPPPAPPFADEEAYVAYELAVTADQMRRGLLKEVVDPRDMSTRLDRCERYARWRWLESRGESL